MMPNYNGILAFAYSYTGDGEAPGYLVRILTTGSDEAVFAQDLPDLLEILSMLAPIVSTGIFADIYKQRLNSLRRR